MSAFLVVGSLNREVPYFQGARGEGLSIFAFDEDDLRFERIAHAPAVENPTYLSVTTDARHIYANSEVAEWREGLVTAFAFDRGRGSLSYLNTQPTLGSIAAHNAVSRDARRLFVVNYTVGEGGPDRSLAVFDRREDGSLSPAIASLRHEGHGPDPVRQERAHAHSVTELAPDLLLVADLGMDALITYRVAADGALTRQASQAAAPGAGPRHVAVHPGGRIVFVMNELDSTVTAHGVAPETGALTLIDRQPAAPAGAGESHGSDIRISADGRFVYGAVRGPDHIAVYAVGEAGRLIPQGFAPCGGRTPRHMVLTPSGRHLLVANQNSDRVSVLARDAATGALRDTGRGLAIGTPMCLAFAG